MFIKNATIFTENNSFQNGSIEIENDLIHSIDFSNRNCSNENTIDAEGLYAIPGLIDIHFHGCMGVDFCDGTVSAFKRIADYELSHGITSICPATMSLPFDTLKSILQNAALFSSDHSSTLVGIHLEGPFLSREKKGAQKEEYLTTADLQQFQSLFQSSSELIKIVTIAPEISHHLSVLREIKDLVRISLGHTAANYSTCCEAFQNGASHVTHLYNAMSPFHHRDPGLIGAAFDHHAEVELIGDGVHIHPSVLRSTFSMFGDDHIILVSDSMEATGMPDGVYSLGNQSVTVRGNRATLSDGTIAGSVTNLMDCVRYLIKEVHLPMESVIKCATRNPAKSIHIFDQYGSIAIGKKADLLLLDSELNIRYIIKNGTFINSLCK